MTTAPDQLADGAHEADLPRSGAARRWRITTLDGQTTEGHLPYWATDDPSETGIHRTDLKVRLADITHHSPLAGQTLRVYSPSHPGGRSADVEILHGGIDCTPYAEPPDARVPVVNMRLTDDCWITDLDPEALASFSAQLRAQADRLDGEVLPALVAARADWAAHHTPTAPSATSDADRS
ncbi:hypothetical protein OG896_20850 [Streptomyces sp. NBC_00669]|uniref:DUF6907 domain-containing protein n=1 Tax=Streptomyces sp. NBC_00669 TaxID=2976011 RepID=UPI002E37662E|nr:hypothetical protein [Streptomyces sp. NBC_00669]